jgi:hypothetical protein
MMIYKTIFLNLNFFKRFNILAKNVGLKQIVYIHHNIFMIKSFYCKIIVFKNLLTYHLKNEILYLFAMFKD